MSTITIDTIDLVSIASDQTSVDENAWFLYGADAPHIGEIRDTGTGDLIARHRTVFRFDLATLPADAVIASCILRMKPKTGGEYCYTLVQPHLSTRASLVKTEAWWEEYAGAQAWAENGGFGAADIQSAAPGNDLPDTGYTYSALLEILDAEFGGAGGVTSKAELDPDATGYALILLRGTETDESSTTQTYVPFQGVGEATPPQLIINYTSASECGDAAPPNAPAAMATFPPLALFKPRWRFGVCGSCCTCWSFKDNFDRATLGDHYEVLSGSWSIEQDGPYGQLYTATSGSVLRLKKRMPANYVLAFDKTIDPGMCLLVYFNWTDADNWHCLKIREPGEYESGYYQVWRAVAGVVKPLTGYGADLWEFVEPSNVVLQVESDRWLFASGIYQGRAWAGSPDFTLASTEILLAVVGTTGGAVKIDNLWLGQPSLDPRGQGCAKLLGPCCGTDDNPGTSGQGFGIAEYEVTVTDLDPGIDGIYSCARLVNSAGVTNYYEPFRAYHPSSYPILTTPDVLLSLGSVELYFEIDGWPGLFAQVTGSVNPVLLTLGDCQIDADATDLVASGPFSIPANAKIHVRSL